MTIIVTDEGFSADTWDKEFTPLGEAANDVTALDVPSDTDPDTIPLTSEIIRVDFPSFADGRGFTIARMLRLRGYKGACAPMDMSWPINTQWHAALDLTKWKSAKLWPHANPKINGHFALIGKRTITRTGFAAHR